MSFLRRGWRRCAVLLLLLFSPRDGSAPGAFASASRPEHYRYEISVENQLSRLVYLTEYPVGPGGYFEVVLEATLTIDTPGADRGRTMLHLLVCDSEAVTQFKHLPVTGVGAPVSTLVPGYCAMANQTLDDLCVSYPLADEAKDDFVYRAEKTIAADWRDDGHAYQGDGMLYFYVDACETVGGAEGVLRSCLDRPDSRVTSRRDDCFACPKNEPPPPSNGTAPNLANGDCIVPPAIRPNLRISVRMNVCDKDGACLSSESTMLQSFYLGATVVWAIAWLVWTTHIRASREAVVELQVKMKQVPLAMLLYTGLTCISFYTDGLLVGTARKLVVNLTILSQVFALALPAEVVVLLAKGWKITRASLDAREHQYIRFVTVAWAIAYAVLKNSVVKHLTVFLIWGVSWSSVVFMIWYNSAFNLNMLLYQIAMIRQMQMETARTPVFVKYQLFRRFRGLLGLYMFCSCVIGILGLVSDATNESWRASATAADETLSVLLYVALGYTFRCRRFSHLIQAPASVGTDASRATADAANASSGPGPSTSAAVAPAAAAPRIDQLPRPKSSMVLVVNPDPHDQSLGMSFVPVHPKGASAAGPAQGDGARNQAGEDKESDKR